ncbi:MAG: BON domain-containing protein [Bdellovibrio sp.]|nr:BON domain-containing protein [Bdellovibrio sp.]
MESFSTKTDAQIQQDVINELNWDQSLISSDVSVTADDGVITLRGTVPHYSDKQIAEVAAKRVSGVRAVAEEIEVKLLEPNERTDEEIARMALNAFDWNYSVPKGIQVTVEKGWVTLTGEAEWEYQRNAAKNSVMQLLGVVAVSNRITIKQKAQPSDIKLRIEEALARSAVVESKNITVAVLGNTVTLSGDLDSSAEIEDARSAAWNAPGVMHVTNLLRVVQ